MNPYFTKLDVSLDVDGVFTDPTALLAPLFSFVTRCIATTGILVALLVGASMKLKLYGGVQ